MLYNSGDVVLHLQLSQKNDAPSAGGNQLQITMPSVLHLLPKQKQWVTIGVITKEEGMLTTAIKMVAKEKTFVVPLSGKS